MSNLKKNISFSTTEGYLFAAAEEVVCCVANPQGAVVYLSTGEQLHSRESLSYLEGLLPEAMFFRAHNSVLVNLNHVRRWERRRGAEHVLVLSNGLVQPLARARRYALKIKLGIE